MTRINTTAATCHRNRILPKGETPGVCLPTGAGTGDSCECVRLSALHLRPLAQADPSTRRSDQRTPFVTPNHPHRD
jgi:hypothetical protein